MQNLIGVHWFLTNGFVLCSVVLQVICCMCILVHTLCMLQNTIFRSLEFLSCQRLHHSSEIAHRL